MPEKQGAEKSFVRGKYVSVERVAEQTDGSVEWRMGTVSDAGGESPAVRPLLSISLNLPGSIPQWITNMSLPGAIAEDVPQYIDVSVTMPGVPSSHTQWMVKNFPEGGPVTKQPTRAAS